MKPHSTNLVSLPRQLIFLRYPLLSAERHSYEVLAPIYNLQSFTQSYNSMKHVPWLLYPSWLQTTFASSLDHAPFLQILFHTLL